MEPLLVLQVIVVTMMVITILMQDSTSDGFTGSGVSTGGLISSRGQADLLSKETKWLAVIFIVNSITLAVWSANTKREFSVIDEIIATEEVISEDDAATETESAVKKAIEAVKDESKAVKPAPSIPLSE